MYDVEVSEDHLGSFRALLLRNLSGGGYVEYSQSEGYHGTMSGTVPDDVNVVTNTPYVVINKEGESEDLALPLKRYVGPTKKRKKAAEERARRASRSPNQSSRLTSSGSGGLLAVGPGGGGAGVTNVTLVGGVTGGSTGQQSSVNLPAGSQAQGPTATGSGNATAGRQSSASVARVGGQGATATAMRNVIAGQQTSANVSGGNGGQSLTANSQSSARRGGSGTSSSIVPGLGQPNGSNGGRVLGGGSRVVGSSSSGARSQAGNGVVGSGGGSLVVGSSSSGAGSQVGIGVVGSGGGATAPPVFADLNGMMQYLSGAVKTIADATADLQGKFDTQMSEMSRRKSN